RDLVEVDDDIGRQARRHGLIYIGEEVRAVESIIGIVRNIPQILIGSPVTRDQDTGPVPLQQRAADFAFGVAVVVVTDADQEQFGPSVHQPRQRPLPDGWELLGQETARQDYIIWPHMVQERQTVLRFMTVGSPWK